ncbi:uncharacterized protein LOC111078750 [Drosophila obscura]|uniref:uncharacterized protein LOC111078750 n=1 Tax=Drosophila obscura TaxID=7282 RepID=UPI001BB22839|nr:uncharacterized protein LOC111078750 [Drosophila obscura]
MPAKSAQNIKTFGKTVPGPAGNNAMGRKTKPTTPSKLSLPEWPLHKRSGGRPFRHKTTEGSDGDSDSSTALCHVVPVRQKPLAAYMHLESASPRAVGANVTPGISYAAAVESVVSPKQMVNVKMAIPPRVKKQPRPAKNNRRAAIDPNFTIFDEEEPKPHLVILYAKEATPPRPLKVRPTPRAETNPVEEMQKQKSHQKQTVKVLPKLLKSQKFFQREPPETAPQDEPQNEFQEPQNELQNDSQNELQMVMSESFSTETDFSGLELEFLGISFQSTESEDTFDLMAAPIELTRANRKKGVPSPEFTDCPSYLSYHLRRLQQILATQCSDSFWNEVALSQKPIECEPVNFQLNERQFQRPDLEAAAFLGQTRAMQRAWLNGDVLIS